MSSGKLLFDVTKASKQSHHSGVLRVSSSLRRELKESLGERFMEVTWSDRKQSFVPASRAPGFRIDREDALLTGELFSEFERPGIEGFLKSGACRCYAIFHDAIPLRHPEFTWPHSVQRHPSYMKMLSLFDGVFGVSQHSSIVLEEYWEWLGYQYSPSVKSIQLGADGLFAERPSAKPFSEGPLDVLMLGIIERRKGHDIALDACNRLWDEEHKFNLHVVGRANPYFGKDIEKRMKKMVKEGRSLVLHGHLKDEALREVISQTDLVLVASRAEGCGLPVLESLWSGLPVLCSKLPPTRENARFGGCRFFANEDSADLASQLRLLLNTPSTLQDLRQEIREDILPTWASAAKAIQDTICPEVHCLV